MKTDKDNFIKPNPYVFPFQEFKDLSNKKVAYPTKSKSLSFDELRKLIERLKTSENLAESIRASLDRNKSIAEKLFDVFMHPSIRFGELKMYEENKPLWIKKFDESIHNKKLIFTLLGFPFKTPVLLKTTRTNPDLGELMALTRLETLAALLESISDTKVKIFAVTEGALGKFVGNNMDSVDIYPDTLKELSKNLSYSHLEFIPLKKMEKYLDQFDKKFEDKVLEFQALYDQRNPAMLKKIEGALPSILRIVNPNNDNIKLLMDVYNYTLPIEKLGSEAKTLRKRIEDKALFATIQYFSYLQMRDNIGFLEKEFGDNYIPLTVSPKPNRLGIIPVRKDVTILPHHGVPVVNHQTNEFSIQYRIDMLRDRNTYTKIHLDQDPDPEPIYYELS